MTTPPDHFDAVADIVEALGRLGFDPVLVGGMALVTLGSRRVTQDFDFLVCTPGDRLDDLVAVFYDHGLELVARFGRLGEVVATIDNPRVAAIRLRLDAPSSAHFHSPTTGLRVDLLFDFPLKAADLAKRARRVAIHARQLKVARLDDLLQLKEIAQANRFAPGDAEDIEFLRTLRGTRR
ncbi:MAG: hypothetical protein ABMA15_26770, partial [Vicinamibacterales bacterium]